MQQEGFADKVVLVTGAASGIGLATAALFAGQGARVVLSDVREDAGILARDQLRQQGAQADFVAADVSDSAQVNALMQAVVERHHRLDIAVNNAGIGGQTAPTAQYPHDDWHRVLAVNLSGVFYCLQAELNIMTHQPEGGAVVNVASVAGLRGLNNSPAYTASKHGVVGLTRAAALEYARRNIRINAVCPVFTRTPLFEKMFEIDPSLEQKLLRNIPMRRYGAPEDVADAIAWLCSPGAGFVTGLALPIDGGMSA